MIARMGTGPRFTSLLVLVAALAGGNNWEVRPQMVTYLLFMIVLWIIYDWQGGKNKPLWVLPVISLVWFNIHGSFVLLFMLGGLAFLLGNGNKRALGMALVISLLVTFITPFERASWLYVFKMLSSQSIKLFSTEWAPTANNHWQMNIFFGWMLAFPLIAISSKHRLDRFDWAVFLFFGWMAFTAQRYVIWQLFILCIFTARLLNDWGSRLFDSHSKKGIPALDYTLSVLFLACSLLFLPGMRSIVLKGDVIPVEIDTPHEAAEWLSTHPELPGPLFSDFAFSSYLVYVLPERPLWADPRFEAYPVEHWEKFKAINAVRWDWQTLLDDEGINLLMISRSGQSELLSALERTPTWCEVYNDKMAVIFTRCGAKQ